MPTPTSADRCARRTLRLALAGIACALAGCSQVYDVRVDAIRTPEIAPRRTYHLVPADPGRAASDPAFSSVQSMVARALEEQGLFAASRAEWADMVVELDYGIGQRRLVSAPDPSARDAGASTVFLPDRSGDTVDATPGIQVPTTAFTRLVAVREKHLSLVACENQSTAGDSVRAGAELWRVDVSVQDPADSIEDLFPILAAALVDSIDRDTLPATTKRISESSARTFVLSQAH